MLTDQTAAKLRCILYGVMFAERLSDGVERTVALVRAGRVNSLAPAECLAAIQEGLASESSIRDVCWMERFEEEAVRRFLAAVARELERESSP